VKGSDCGLIFGTICPLLGRTEKTMKKLGQDGWSLGRDFNLQAPEYEAGA
jgi:hypothetical protein